VKPYSGGTLALSRTDTPITGSRTRWRRVALVSRFTRRTLAVKITDLERLTGR